MILASATKFQDSNPAWTFVYHVGEKSQMPMEKSIFTSVDRVLQIALPTKVV